jgi:hypothetical protein
MIRSTVRVIAVKDRRFVFDSGRSPAREFATRHRGGGSAIFIGRALNEDLSYSKA